MTQDVSGIRLNKYISETGICSRREADIFIEEGRVKVNGKVAGMGLRVTAADFISVGGKPLKAKPAPVYLVYNKPVGITCTTDPEVPDNIVAAVNYRKGRIFPIGRLDKPSEGLILLTNDGDIVNKILRAGNAHDKEYIVSVDKPFDAEFIRRMAAGIPILGTVTKPCKVRKISATSFNIILHQGLNRQIRRMTEYLGYNVTRLKRVRIMNIGLDGLKVGQWRLLNQKELSLVADMLANSSSTVDVEFTPKKQIKRFNTTKVDKLAPSKNKPFKGKKTASETYKNNKKSNDNKRLGKKTTGKRKGAGGKSIKRP
ncbi:MAG TPA: 23S rRNA pseudouridine(2604) synthase RluF [Marinospirillum sp.]|uniref:23S rRNA pseudouridine(2604) synthase RluF n=1 Tax=Marinospirillum sp. TaxID=2183934 RepID=UPI002B4773E2|nr:23S rRNA pseudouridine(2604) synthase RluF [Marinospirillum sp.]HKM15100.1 23S rRNA pseudouridine(2604) synthase RluF [Marinospirillum sp.]